MVFYIFFQGEKIEKNIRAWLSMWSSVRGTFERFTFGDRATSASAAVEHISDQRWHVPETLRLVRYFQVDLVGLEEGQRADVAWHHHVPIHGFVIEADDQKYLLFVYGTSVLDPEDMAKEIDQFWHYWWDR
jgi:hypothetical protein